MKLFCLLICAVLLCIPYASGLKCYVCSGWVQKCDSPIKSKDCGAGYDSCKTVMSGSADPMWVMKQCDRNCVDNIKTCKSGGGSCNLCCKGDDCNAKDLTVADLRKLKEGGAVAATTTMKPTTTTTTTATRRPTTTTTRRVTTTTRAPRRVTTTTARQTPRPWSPDKMMPSTTKDKMMMTTKKMEAGMTTEMKKDMKTEGTGDKSAVEGDGDNSACTMVINTGLVVLVIGYLL